MGPSPTASIKEPNVFTFTPLTPYLIGFLVGTLTALLIVLLARRRQFVFMTQMSPVMRERVRKLQELGETSLGDTFSRALAIYELCLKAHADGKAIHFRNNLGEEQEMILK